jgi:hypothetical protein
MRHAQSRPISGFAPYIEIQGSVSFTMHDVRSLAIASQQLAHMDQMRTGWWIQLCQRKISGTSELKNTKKC